MLWRRVLSQYLNETSASEKTKTEIEKIVRDYIQGKIERREMFRKMFKFLPKTRTHRVYDVSEFLQIIGSNNVVVPNLEKLIKL